MGSHVPILAASSLALGLLLAASPTHADIILLQNDTFTDGDAVAFQGGFNEGESAGVTLGPVEETFVINRIRFLLGGGGEQQTIRLYVYEDTGVDDPGPVMFTGEYQAQSADDAFQDIDLTGENLQLLGGGSIRVAFEFMHDGYPSVARDDDGSCTPGANWLHGVVDPPSPDPAWYDTCDIGVTGDWIIRAEVETEGTGGTGGTGGSGGSGGTGGTGAYGGSGGGTVCTPDETVKCLGLAGCVGTQTCAADGSGFGPCTCDSAEDDDGCGCRAAGQGPAREGFAGLLCLSALCGLVLRRRRRTGC